MGDNPKHVFTICTDSRNISLLKEDIMNKKGGADTSKLNLFKVSIPDENLDMILNEILKSGIRGELLQSMQVLSEVFSESPSPTHLHIIIQCPPAREDFLLPSESECLLADGIAH